MLGRKCSSVRELALGLALEFDECGEDTEYEPATGCCVDVNALAGLCGEADLSRHQIGGGVDKVTHFSPPRDQVSRRPIALARRLIFPIKLEKCSATPPAWLQFSLQLNHFAISTVEDGLVDRKRTSHPTYSVSSGCGLMPAHERSI